MKTLDGVDTGTGYEARLVQALLRHRQDAANDGWLGEALCELADETMSESAWTPYRWLRGAATPRSRVVTRLERLAGEWGVELPTKAVEVEAIEAVEESPPAA